MTRVGAMDARAFAAALGASCVVACGAIVGLAPYDAESAGGESGARSGDAPLGDAAAGDARASDAVATRDAAESLLGARCADVDALFCEDFDEPDGAVGLGQVQQGAAPWVISSAKFTSAPRALISTVTTDPSNAVYSIARRYYDSLPFARASIEVDTLVEQVGAQDAYIVDIQYGRATTEYSVSLILQDGQVSIAESGTGVDYSSQACGPFAVGSWWHAAFGIDLDLHRSSLVIDGGAACTKQLTPIAHTSDDATMFDVGFVYVDPQAASTWAVRFDSVVLRAQ